jgi:transcriptional regulator with XRE-family HTH domain
VVVRLDRAVEADEIVRALAGYGLTQADIGAAAGVSVRSARNWARDGVLRRAHEERLLALRQVVPLLDDSLSPRGVGQWLRAHNTLLGGRRPLELLADGDVDDVRGAAAAFADGSYV